MTYECVPKKIDIKKDDEKVKKAQTEGVLKASFDLVASLYKFLNNSDS